MNPIGGASYKVPDEKVSNSKIHTCFGDFQATNTIAKRRYFAITDDFKELFHFPVCAV